MIQQKDPCRQDWAYLFLWRVKTGEKLVQANPEASNTNSLRWDVRLGQTYGKNQNTEIGTGIYYARKYNFFPCAEARTSSCRSLSVCWWRSSTRIGSPDYGTFLSKNVRWVSQQWQVQCFNSPSTGYVYSKDWDLCCPQMIMSVFFSIQFCMWKRVWNFHHLSRKLMFTCGTRRKKKELKKSQSPSMLHSSKMLKNWKNLPDREKKHLRTVVYFFDFMPIRHTQWNEFLGRESTRDSWSLLLQRVKLFIDVNWFKLVLQHPNITQRKSFWLQMYLIKII